MTTPRAAAIYARISSDRDGTALGVTRQLADCRAEAGRRDWMVAEEYVDNDISAHSGKLRPDYRRMLDDIAARHVDAVIVYDLDRLHRQPKELEEFLEVCERAGLDTVITVHGDHNLGTSDGLFVARMLSALAAAESDKKAQRVRRKMDELAEAGMPHGGATRPFGYDWDRMTVIESEAAVIRDVAARFLAGESLHSLAKWLTESEHTTTTGKDRWLTSTVRGMLLSARISGRREHRGQIVGPAAWPAIITVDESEQIRATLNDPARRTNRTARRYLLAGKLRCHHCDEKMVAHPRNGQRRYGCKSGPDFTGCGKTYIVADPVEQLVTEAVLHRLDTPALAAALAGEAAADEQTAALSEEVAAAKAKLDELADLYSNDQISAPEWIRARKPIEARHKQAKGRLGRLSRSRALDSLTGNGSQLRADWSGLNLDRQRAIVDAILDQAIIGPGKPSAAVDLDRVRPIWRL
jgi:site-specific DNA recombinase